MDFEKLKDIRNSTNPFAQQLGIWVEEIREGYARVTKTIGPDDLNPVNAPHGGVYFSMADTVSGSAMASHGYYAVTVNASYNYLRSGSVGDVFTAQAREVKSGRTLSVFDVEITNQDGMLLGTGTFTFFRLDKKIEL